MFIFKLFNLLFVFLIFLTNCSQTEETSKTFFQIRNVRILSLSDAFVSGPRTLLADEEARFRFNYRMTDYLPSELLLPLFVYSSVISGVWHSEFEASSYLPTDYHLPNSDCRIQENTETFLQEFSNRTHTFGGHAFADTLDNLSMVSSCEAKEGLSCLAKVTAILGADIRSPEGLDSAMSVCFSIEKDKTNYLKPIFTVGKSDVRFAPWRLYFAIVYEGNFSTYETAQVNIPIATLTPPNKCQEDITECLISPIPRKNCVGCDYLIPGRTYTAFLKPYENTIASKYIPVVFVHK